MFDDEESTMTWATAGLLFCIGGLMWVGIVALVVWIIK